MAESDYPHLYTEVTLGPLSDGDTKDLLENLIAIADLTERERQIILEKTDGNPFYVEEMIRGLIDSGSVVRDANSGIWRAVKDIELIAVPDNVTTEAAAEAARRHIRPQEAQIVLVGDADEIGPPLEALGLGPLEVTPAS